MKIQKIHTADGFVLFDCGIGACPEIKQVGDEYIVRSLRNPKSEVAFTKDELTTFKNVVGQYV
jgi:hypothetical protein